MSDWFETGTQGVEREKFEREQRRSQPWRFFLKTGQSARIIFLDDFTKTRTVELPGSGEVVKQPTVPLCFAAGMPILTDNGVLPIEEVKVGNRVMRKDGTWGEVKQTHTRKYSGPMISVRTAKNSEIITGTADHRVPIVQVGPCVHQYEGSRNRTYCYPSCKESCRNSGRSYDIIEKRLGDLCHGDFLLLAGAHNCPDAAVINHPTGSKKDVKIEQSKVTEELAWLIGAYVAEGCNHHGPVFTVHRDETDFQNSILELMKTIFNLDGHMQDHPTGLGRQICFYSTKVGDWFEAECGRHAKNKHFPQWIMEAPRSIQSSALDGYLTGDGCDYNNQKDNSHRMMMATVSKTLAYQARALAISFGRKPSFNIRLASTDSKGVSRQESYWLSWSMNSKFTDGFFIDGMLAVPVLEVSSNEVVDVDVYNLGVDGEHFYTVCGIAVHNCYSEHQLTIDGDWKNWYTCLAKIDPPCPICSAGYYKYYIGQYTILAEWVDDDGIARWSKKLYAAKIDGIERVRLKQAQYVKDGRIPDKQFQYCMFHVSRMSERSVVTGDDMEFIKKLSKDEVAGLLPQPQQGQEPISIEPYDYKKLFAPKPRGELEALLRSGRVQPPRKKSSSVKERPDAFSGKSTVGAPAEDGGSDDGNSPADAIDF